MSTKRCPGCTATLPRAFFGVDKTRRDGLAGRCRTCNARSKRPSDAARGSLGRGLHLTAEEHADRMISEALSYADANGVDFAINTGHLLPLPPLCPLTLDNLVDGDDAQAPVMARLVDTEGFTPENVVVLSVRSKRRHQVIGSRGLRQNLGKPLTRTQAIVTTEVVGRFNGLCWSSELIDVAAEVDGLEVAASSGLVVPPNGRRVKRGETAGETAQNWCDLISDEAQREYIAAGHRLPPERDQCQPLSFALRMTKSPAEWLEWAHEYATPEGPWRIPEPKAARYGPSPL